jgi:2-haloacid dehalogenase
VTDTVIFDIGNVLIRWDMRNLYRRLFGDEAAMEAFFRETGLPAENLEFDRGKPFALGLGDLASRFPRYADALLAFDRRWTECLDGAIEPNVKVLQDLQRAGVATHAITNFSAEKFPIACRLFPFLMTFEETIVSGTVGLLKPDPAIYRLLLDKCSIEPSRAVFLDDSAPNVDAAKALGLHAIHVTPRCDVRSELRALGLPGL